MGEQETDNKNRKSSQVPENTQPSARAKPPSENEAENMIRNVKTIEHVKPAKPWRSFDDGNPVLDEYWKNGRETIVVTDAAYPKFKLAEFSSFNVKSESQHKQDQQREIEETRLRDEATRKRNEETHIRYEKIRREAEEKRIKEQKYQEDQRKIEVRRANLEISQAEQALKERRLTWKPPKSNDSDDEGWDMDEGEDDNGEDKFDEDEYEDLEDDK